MDHLEFFKKSTGLNIDNVAQGARLDSIVGWDSLAMVNLVVALEEKINRMLELDEMESIETIDDVETLLKS